MTPEDEKAIADAVEQRRAQAQADAEAAVAAQPKCCALWWQRHTRDCPNRTWDPEVADFWRRVKRMGLRIVKGLLR